MDTIATGRSHSFASPWHCQSLLHQLNGFWRLALNVQISQKEDIPLMKATLIMRHVTILLELSFTVVSFTFVGRCINVKL